MFVLGHYTPNNSANIKLAIAAHYSVTKSEFIYNPQEITESQNLLFCSYTGSKTMT